MQVNMRLLMFALILMTFSCDQKEKNTVKDSREHNLVKQIDSLHEIIDELKGDADYYFREDYGIEYFKERGIENPKKFIDSSLRARTDLIPLKAILGGTMHFNKISVLSSKWLIADYDDGHILGISIYKYELNDKNELDFKKLAEIRPEDE